MLLLLVRLLLLLLLIFLSMPTRSARVRLLGQPESWIPRAA